MNFAMFPTDKGVSVSPFVAKIIEVVRSKGYENQLTAMGTLVETETLDEALSVISETYKVLEKDSERVYVSLNLDIKKGPKGRIRSKVASVENKLK
jgi:uncharacterized protein (TIGR00106 family)